MLVEITPGLMLEADRIDYVQAYEKDGTMMPYIAVGWQGKNIEVPVKGDLYQEYRDLCAEIDTAKRNSY